MSDDLIPLASLVPGARFTREGVPHVVYVKTSHTWASLTWKGRTTSVPFHPTDRVRPAGDMTNPGETLDT